MVVVKTGKNVKKNIDYIILIKKLTFLRYFQQLFMTSFVFMSYCFLNFFIVTIFNPWSSGHHANIQKMDTNFHQN